MRNLDQVRAAAASQLLPEGKKHPFDRGDVASIPALILSNGLLPAAAFCCEEGKEARVRMRAAFNGIAEFLKQREIAGASVTTGHQLITDLATKDSNSLERATAEALAYLAVLKRFALPKAKP